MAFGDQIQAGLMNPDFSAIERAGQARGMGMQAIGQGIGSALESFGEMKKKQSEMEKTIKQSELYIDAAMKLFPEMGESLGQAKMQIYDVNAPLKDRFAVAESVQGLLNLSMQRMQMDSQQMESLRKMQADEAERAARPLKIEKVYDSEGNIRQMVNQGGQLRPLEEVIGGNVPQLPADMQNEIDTTMPPLDGMGGGVLPGRPIEGQIEQLLGMTPEGNVRLIAGGSEIETDKGTFAQKLIGDMTQGGEDPTQAAAQAAQVLAALEMDAQRQQQPTPVLGIKPPDERKTPPVVMTMEQVDELTSKGMRVEARPRPDRKFDVTSVTASMENKGITYTEPYIDERGDLVQRASNGQIKVMRESADERTLAVIQKAREAYNSGDTNQALDLLASVRIKGAFGGYPTPDDLAEYFGVVAPQEVQPTAPTAPALGETTADRLRRALEE